jgi:quinoprotein relay system zinc metallohydrolase 2
MGAPKSRLVPWLLACPLAFAAEVSEPFNLSEPEPGVFVHVGRQLPLDAPGHDDIANIGFIVGEKCVAVIDTGGSATVGRELRAAVGARTSLAICYVINTHVHVDHVLGNAVFKNDGPSFVGHAALKEAMDRSRKFFIETYPHDLDAPLNGLQVIGPDRLVERELDLDLGGRRLVLRAWPKAHSDCDLTVYDAQTRTLWTGDLLFRERLPVLDGSVKGWLAVLDEVEHMQVRLAVPGHGPPARDLAMAIAPERRYLQALLDGVREALRQNKAPEAAISSAAAPEKSHWLLWDSVHPHNVLRAYQELEWE